MKRETLGRKSPSIARVFFRSVFAHPEKHELLDLLDALPSSIAVLDGEGEIVFVNRAWRQFTPDTSGPGPSPRFVGMNYLEAWREKVRHDEFAEKVVRAIEAGLNGTIEQQTLEYPSSLYGSCRWFLMVIQMRPGPNAGVIISRFEITTRKLAELAHEDLTKNLELKVAERTNELAVSERNHRLFFEEAFDSILVADEGGKILRVNKQLTNKFGYSATELLGQPIEMLMPERYRIAHVPQRIAYSKAPRARAMGTGLQLFGRQKDGAEFPIDVSLSHISTGESIQMVAIIRDISARKRNEDREAFLSKISKMLSDTVDYRERVQRTADTVIETLADACVVSTLEGNSLKYRAIAVRDERLRPDLEAIVSQLQKIQERDCPSARVLKSLKSIVMTDVQSEYLDREKIEDSLRERLARLHVDSCLIAPMISHGKGIGTITFLRTNSGQHFSTDDLGFFELVASRCAVAVENAKLYNEAQEAIRSRELVLSIVSHDLRNPVATIDMSAQVLGNSELLAKTNQATVVERIRHSTAMMEQMISDLLDFSKAQAGTFTLQQAPISVSSLLDTALETMADRLSAKRIRLHIDYLPSTVMIYGDHRRLVQVLWNLIGNAIKFTPENGKIKVSATVSGDDVCLSVSDSGPGLTRDELPKVFDQFWQSAKTAQLGTGLGLAIAKGIVDAHRGKIWVESEKDQGCKFSFTIPTHHEASAQKQVKQLQSEISNSKTLMGVRILAVDDSACNRDLVQVFLEKAGAQVVAVESLTEAIEKTSIWKPAVVLTDIEMPQNDGFELLARIRQFSKSQATYIPVVALTAHSSAEQIAKIENAGFDGHVIRPVDADRLIECVGRFAKLRQSTHRNVEI